MDNPQISVLVPTYNRSKFTPLFIFNLKKQTYPHRKIEVVIDDDGTEPFCDSVEELKKTLSPMKLIYHRNKKKRTIGEKRNNLVKLSTSKFLINMDDDDIYNPAYIEYSLLTLKENKCGLVGSNAMIFCYPEKDFRMTSIQCKHKYQIHEATMCYTKKYFRSMGGFKKNSQGEGVNMIQKQDHNVGVTDIALCMICIAHDGNTIDKEQFNFEGEDQIYRGKEVPILKQILSLK